jgi:alkaline phosphatase D
VIFSRRDLLRAAAAAAAPLPFGPSAYAARGGGPVASGLQVGDPLPGGQVLCALSDRPARLLAEWTTDADPGEPQRARGGLALPSTDHSAQLVLTDLPPDRTVTLAARFEDLRTGALSEPVFATWRTAPATRRDVRICWGGDLAGQGWGIDPARGGYRAFERLLARDPDLFLFTGDRIYADQPIEPSVPLPDGSTWNNLTTEATSRVAETVDDFRGRYRYHHLDPAFRRLCATVPTVHQWDDHEVVDNWCTAGRVKDDRYVVRDMATLAVRARQAWGEHTPMRPVPFDWSRIYRRVAYGPLLDVFVLDGRSYRSENNANLAQYPRPDAQLYGRPQLAWLKRGLRRSTAQWKLVLTGQPLSLLAPAWPDRTSFDGMAGGPGDPLGREHELDDLLRFLKAHDLHNVVFLSGDLHLAAAVHHHPDRATMQQFLPFWEFVAGPLHAGAYGPAMPDPTFGPEVRYERGAPDGQLGIGPWSDRQFFGEVSVSGASGALSVRLFDNTGALLHTEALVSGA